MTYDDTNTLLADADVIIKGRLIEEIPELRNDLVFTYECLQATEVYKGDISIGDSLKILQTGGEYEEVFTPTIDDAPLFSEIISESGMDNDEFFLCLKRTEYDELYGSYYLICGGFQGVGKIVEKGNEEMVVSLVDTDEITIGNKSLAEIKRAVDDMASKE